MGKTAKNTGDREAATMRSIASTPSEFTAASKSEQAKWAEVIKAAGIKE